MSVSPIATIARTIVTQSIDCQASTIQLELREDRMEVDCQRDGGTHHLVTFSGGTFRPVVTRYKLWAAVDLLDRRYPLQGRFSLIHGHRHYHVDVTWEDPWPHRKVTLSIAPGAAAPVEHDDPRFAP